MRVLYSPASPYSAKVRMAAHYGGLTFDSVLTDTASVPDELVNANPLGKIPTLVTADGRAIYDSRAIMRFIDGTGEKRLYPRNVEKRTEVDILEALADGICDSLLAIVYERRYRPEDKVHQDWIDRQWAKAERGLDHLNANLPRTGKTLHAGHFALAALIPYLALRFPGKWERGRAKLKNWPDRFERFFPDYPTLKPQA